MCPHIAIIIVLQSCPLNRTIQCVLISPLSNNAQRII